MSDRGWISHGKETKWDAMTTGERVSGGMTLRRHCARVGPRPSSPSHPGWPALPLCLLGSCQSAAGASLSRCLPPPLPLSPRLRPRPLGVAAAAPVAAAAAAAVPAPRPHPEPAAPPVAPRPLAAAHPVRTDKGRADRCRHHGLCCRACRLAHPCLRSPGPRQFPHAGLHSPRHSHWRHRPRYLRPAARVAAAVAVAAAALPPVEHPEVPVAAPGLATAAAQAAAPAAPVAAASGAHQAHATRQGGARSGSCSAAGSPGPAATAAVPCALASRPCTSAARCRRRRGAVPPRHVPVAKAARSISTHPHPPHRHEPQTTRSRCAAGASPHRCACCCRRCRQHGWHHAPLRLQLPHPGLPQTCCQRRAARGGVAAASAVALASAAVSARQRGRSTVRGLRHGSELTGRRSGDGTAAAEKNHPVNPSGAKLGGWPEALFYQGGASLSTIPWPGLSKDVQLLAYLEVVVVLAVVLVVVAVVGGDHERRI
eukprot:360626-Chlamydomonas_euryale.AAC.7